MTVTVETSVNSNGHASRLHLGGGEVFLSGFEQVDRRHGREVYPLDVPDNSVEEMVASHVLEHFGYQEVFDVLKHWVDKLKPGGRIRLAVPDFDWIARAYLAGEPVNIMGYTMGSQSDENDYHRSIFDRHNLAELMYNAGLERIGDWKSDIPGCSLLPCSLNLQGFKPVTTEKKVEGIRACLSVPRFGPLMHPRCFQKAANALGINTNFGQSCFWHQMISVQMEEAIEDPSCQYVLTMDYDTIFSPDDVLELYRLMKAVPEVDAVFPMQSKRGCEQALFSIHNAAGQMKGRISEVELNQNLLPAATGHFGLTMFRADSLRKFPRPWMVPEPNKEGKWNNGQTDADIVFWRNFRAAGFKCYLAPRVVVGHLEEVVKWPGKDLKPVYQTASEYEESGIPAEVAR